MSYEIHTHSRTGELIYWFFESGVGSFSNGEYEIIGSGGSLVVPPDFTEEQAISEAYELGIIAKV